MELYVDKDILKPTGDINNDSLMKQMNEALDVKHKKLWMKLCKNDDSANKQSKSTANQTNGFTEKSLQSLVEFLNQLLLQVKQHQNTTTNHHSESTISKENESEVFVNNIFDKSPIIANSETVVNLNGDSNKLESNIEGLEKLIQSKDEIIRQKCEKIEELETSLSEIKSTMVNEFQLYENNVLGLVKNYETKKTIKTHRVKRENQNLKQKLEMKRKHIIHLHKEIEKYKLEIEKLQIIQPNNYSTEDTKGISLEELNQTIVDLMAEKGKHQNRIDNQNKIIKKLMQIIKKQKFEN